MTQTTKCFWPWSHQWAKWKDVGSGEIGFGSFSQPVLLQERECEYCGKKERHYVTFQNAA